MTHDFIVIPMYGAKHQLHGRTLATVLNKQIWNPIIPEQQTMTPNSFRASTILNFLYFETPSPRATAIVKQFNDNCFMILKHDTRRAENVNT